LLRRLLLLGRLLLLLSRLLLLLGRLLLLLSRLLLLLSRLLLLLSRPLRLRSRLRLGRGLGLWLLLGGRLGLLCEGRLCMPRHSEHTRKAHTVDESLLNRQSKHVCSPV
jgi:hypothetical protein